MTIKQISDVCKLYSYIALRNESGYLMGINCKIAFLKSNKGEPETETEFISYIPISFSEYINIKHPFLCGN